MDDVIVKREIANIWMSRKKLIQFISDLGQANLLVQAYNHLEYLLREKRLTHLKMLGRVVADQATNTEQSQICVS